MIDPAQIGDMKDNIVSKPEKSEDQKSELISCGLVMPISEIDGCPADHWQRVLAIIKESLRETDFKPELVSEREDTGIIQATIVQRLADDPIVICDVSGRNPNVMFELGLRLAFNRPVVIIKDDKTAYPFDTSPLQYIEYRRDLRYPDVQQFEADLARRVLATYEAAKSAKHPTFLEHFGRLKSKQELPTQEVAVPQAILDQLAVIRSEIGNLAQRIVAPGGATVVVAGKKTVFSFSGPAENLDALFEAIPTVRLPSSSKWWKVNSNLVRLECYNATEELELAFAKLIQKSPVRLSWVTDG